MPRRREPRWLTRRVLDVIHDAQIREHGGTPGVRDDGLLESALARPRQKWTYAEKPDLATLAAAYVFGLVKNHGYVDGSKRVAFMAAYVFVGLNGYDLELDETDVAATIERAAAGAVSEPALAEWLRQKLKRLDSPVVRRQRRQEAGPRRGRRARSASESPPPRPAGAPTGAE